MGKRQDDSWRKNATIINLFHWKVASCWVTKNLFFLKKPLLWIFTILNNRWRVNYQSLEPDIDFLSSRMYVGLAQKMSNKSYEKHYTFHKLLIPWYSGKLKKEVIHISWTIKQYLIQKTRKHLFFWVEGDTSWMSQPWILYRS